MKFLFSHHFVRLGAALAPLPAFVLALAPGFVSLTLAEGEAPGAPVAQTAPSPSSPEAALMAEARAAADAPPATAEQRARRYPGAALLPADVTCLASLADSPVVRASLSLFCLRRDLPLVQHATIGLTSPLAEALAAQLSHLQGSNEKAAAVGAVPFVLSAEEEDPLGKIGSLLINTAKSNPKLSPAYLVLGCGDRAAAACEQHMHRLAKAVGAQPVRYKALKGYRLSLGALHCLSSGKPADSKPGDTRPPGADRSGAEGKPGEDSKPNTDRVDEYGALAGRYLHLLYVRRDGMSLWVLTENPRDIRLPATAADSVLATDFGRLADGHTDRQPHLIAKLDAAPLRALAAALLHHGKHAAAQLHEQLFASAVTSSSFAPAAADAPSADAVFPDVTSPALASGADAAAHERQHAEASFAELAAMGDQSLEPILRLTEPLTLRLRYDAASAAVHIEACGDACGLSFEPEPLYLTSSTEDPSVILSAESAPANLATLPDSDAVCNALEHCLAHALNRWSERPADSKDSTSNTNNVNNADHGQDAATTGSVVSPGSATNAAKADEAAATKANDAASLYRLLRPSLRQAGRALRTVQRSLSRHGGLVLREQPRTELSLSLHAPVSNPRGLQQGWEELMDAVDAGVRAVGMHPDVINMLPVAVQDGPCGSTSYRLLLPVSLPGLSPGILVSDTDLLLGSNAEADRALLARKTSSEPLPGAVFHLNVRAALSLLSRRGALPQAWESGPAGELLHRLRTVTGCLTVQQGKARLHLLLHF